jgi:hypothetical protein
VYPGTRTNYPGIQVVKKPFKYSGTRVIDTRHWTHYRQMNYQLGRSLNQSIFDVEIPTYHNVIDISKFDERYQTTAIQKLIKLIDWTAFYIIVIAKCKIIK